MLTFLTKISPSLGREFMCGEYCGTGSLRGVWK